MFRKCAVSIPNFILEKKSLPPFRLIFFKVTILLSVTATSSFAQTAVPSPSLSLTRICGSTERDVEITLNSVRFGYIDANDRSVYGKLKTNIICDTKLENAGKFAVTKRVDNRNFRNVSGTIDGWERNIINLAEGENNKKVRFRSYSKTLRFDWFAGRDFKSMRIRYHGDLSKTPIVDLEESIEDQESVYPRSIADSMSDPFFLVAPVNLAKVGSNYAHRRISEAVSNIRNVVIDNRVYFGLISALDDESQTQEYYLLNTRREILNGQASEMISAIAETDEAKIEDGKETGEILASNHQMNYLNNQNSVVLNVLEEDIDTRLPTDESHKFSLAVNHTPGAGIYGFAYHFFDPEDTTGSTGYLSLYDCLSGEWDRVKGQADVRLSQVTSKIPQQWRRAMQLNELAGCPL